MKHTISVLLGIFLVVSAWAQAPQSCRMTTYTAADGLSQSRVTAVEQDADGVLWIATWDGLNRYDGYEFSCYKSLPGNHEPLVQNRIDVLAVNSENDIWCIGRERFYLFRNRQGHFDDVQSLLEERFKRTVTAYKVVSLKNGFSWLIEEDGTLYRIDDKDISSPTLYPNPLPKKRKIYDIKLDSQGNEWILTDQGIMTVGRNSFRNNLTYKSWTERDNRIWLGTPECRIATYDMKTGELAFVENIPPTATHLYRMLFANDTTIVVATNAGILFIDSRTQAVKQQLLPTRTGSQEVISCFGKKGFYCLITKDMQTYVLHADSRRIEPLKQAKETVWSSQDVTRPLFFNNPSGDLFLFLRSGGLHRIDTLALTLAPYNVGRFLSQTIRLVSQDKQGNIWVGCNSGLHKLQFGNEGIYPLPDYLKGEIRCTFVDSAGRMWISTRDGMVEIREGGKRLGYLSPEGRIVPTQTLFSAGIYAMMEDKDHNLWVGTKGEGLYRMRYADPHRYRITGHFKPDGHKPYSLSGEAVYAILQDKNGHIWVGCYDFGLNLIESPNDPAPLFFHEHNRLALRSGSKPKQVRCIAETDDGVILVGTTQGLFTFDENFYQPEDLFFYCNVRQKDDEHSLGGNDVMGIEVAENGDIYVAAFGGGLNKILSPNLLSDNIRFKSYTKQAGAYSDVALNVTEDRNGYIWVISERLLMRFNPRNENFENFGNDIFPRYTTLSENKPYIYPDGKLLVSTGTGVAMVEPDKIDDNNYIPSIVFGTGTEEIRLKATERTLSVPFVAVDFSSDAAIRYAYKLEGVDKEWTITSDNLTANYINLPAGNFKLRVKSTNRNGLWVDNERTLPVSRQPAFAETPYAICLYVVLAIALISLIVFIYLHIYKLRYRLRVEHQLTEAKLRFFTDISHELRTPLTLIEGPLSEVLEDEQLPEQDKEYLTVVQTNAHRMLNLINQILDFRKIQNEKMRLLVEKLNVREELESIMENFDNIARMNKIDFRLEMGTDDMYVWADKDKFEKIFINLLSNAFKYTPAGKSVTVEVAREDDRIVIAVHDKGVGIPPAKIETLFQRFDTILQNNIYKQSTGIGLSLVKQLAELHHAEISVHSRTGEGSTFEVAFLTGKDHFEKDAQAEFLLNDSEADDEEEIAEEIEGSDGDDRFSILVVEDNRDLRAFLQNSLRRSYKVYTACNGEEGWTQTLEYMPDLVITDLMMPELDGFGLIDRIKANATTCHIPIIVLTAKATLDDRIRGANSGIADYMVKPFSTQLLKARVAMIQQQQQLLREKYMEHIGQNSAGETGYQLPELSIMPADEQFMQKLLAYVDANLDNSDLSVDDLAREMALSRSVFFRKIKALVGQSPINFLQTIRIKRAIQLMQSRNFSIAEVAYKVGYADPKYFSRSFKKITGKSPSAYVKKQ